MAERPNPARVVADADVLAADLLVGGETRAALDHVRAHSWVELLTSDPLLERTETLVARLADADLAAAHRARLETDSRRVDHPEGDHPALATAYRGRAAHLLSFDDRLRSAATGAALQPRVALSIRSPDAFARLFDPESLYEALEGGPYPGPDRDPRA
ncbi:DUF7384 family protein [Natronobiforma cellulositropha]|uniref:DUF7384 family protein n=1 Tax=Natronobiforma cellulositropha TaxID=1679076 RepID=UPI0021D5D329|nr:hypothetical protein [Natronobiforma cellulositropha]